MRVLCCSLRSDCLGLARTDANRCLDPLLFFPCLVYGIGSGVCPDLGSRLGLGGVVGKNSGCNFCLGILLLCDGVDPIAMVGGSSSGGDEESFDKGRIRVRSGCDGMDFVDWMCLFL